MNGPRSSSATDADVTFQMAEVAVPRQTFADILSFDHSAARAARTGMTGGVIAIREVRAGVP